MMFLLGKDPNGIWQCDLFLWAKENTNVVISWSFIIHDDKVNFCIFAFLLKWLAILNTLFQKSMVISVIFYINQIVSLNFLMK